MDEQELNFERPVSIGEVVESLEKTFKQNNVECISVYTRTTGYVGVIEDYISSYIVQTNTMGGVGYTKGIPMSDSYIIRNTVDKPLTTTMIENIQKELSSK